VNDIVSGTTWELKIFLSIGLKLSRVRGLNWKKMRSRRAAFVI